MGEKVERTRYKQVHSPSIINKAGKLQRANKYMFGIKIPRTIHEAYTFDKEHKNNKWTEAIKTEVNRMGEHRVFKKLPMGNVPDDEKLIF